MEKKRKGLKKIEELREEEKCCECRNKIENWKGKKKIIKREEKSHRKKRKDKCERNRRRNTSCGLPGCI